MSKPIRAKDCKCKCGAQAAAFWPVIDPDIPSHPYCRACLNVAQLRLWKRMADAGAVGEIVSNKKGK